jgi:hypothetical protein
MNLQNELHEHKRGDQKYIELMRREFDIVQRKDNYEERYQILDRQERELFSHLQSKINVLHEKTRTHTRQWGLISTVIGAMLGIVGTSISAYFRNKDIRNIQKGMQAEFQEQVDQIRQDTQEIVRGYDKLMLTIESYDKRLQESSRPSAQGESWTRFFKRKTIGVWKWCTFQSSSSSNTN